MKFGELIETVGSEPIFSSAFLMAGKRSRQDIQLQLTRWTAAGKLCQLRRGLYALLPPYRKITPHPFLMANRICKASYVSLQSALAYYGLIPEYTPVVTSITTGRPETVDTPSATFSFKHIKKPLFMDYSSVTLTHQQSAFVASPEKSLLDLIYLTPHGDGREYLRELRLQNMDRLNMEHLMSLAHKSGSQKLMRASRQVANLAGEEEDYKDL